MFIFCCTFNDLSNYHQFPCTPLPSVVSSYLILVPILSYWSFSFFVVLLSYLVIITPKAISYFARKSILILCWLLKKHLLGGDLCRQAASCSSMWSRTSILCISFFLFLSFLYSIFSFFASYPIFLILHSFLFWFFSTSLVSLFWVFVIPLYFNDDYY